MIGRALPEALCSVYCLLLGRAGQFSKGIILELRRNV